MSASIKVNEEEKVFLISMGSFSYGFRTNENGFLTNVHWGGVIDRIEDLPSTQDLHCQRHCYPRLAEVTRQEYSGWGGSLIAEPCLKADLPDGVRGITLRYAGYQLNDEEGGKHLVVTIADPDYQLSVRLHYRVYDEADVIDRWSEVVNGGDGTVTLQNVMSAGLHLPRIGRHDYRLTQLAGKWGKEGTISRLPVTQGKTVMDSRTGLSGSFAMPLFAIDEGRATEKDGRVWFGTVQWSGNWKITVERDAFDLVSVYGGINDFDFSWPMKPGETFTTPVFTVGLSENGFGEASRMLHRYQRNCVMPAAEKDRIMPVIFNSWSCMGVDVNEEKIVAAAKIAADIGAELFVIDDGWQNYLGDWWADPKKFPDGLKPVIDKVAELGMDFGLWVEIESFEIKSELYKVHPEWAMQYKNREPAYKTRSDVGRTSFLLNFAREDVCEYMYQAMRKVIQETGIKYMKLDMNCFVTDPGWIEVPEEEQQTMWVKYTRNIYSLFGRLKEEFPEVLFENCASGAGRSDLAMTHFFGRINRSDNQDTLDILKLHEGFTWLHLPKMAGGACHISDAACGINVRDLPMSFMGITGMTGALAIGKNLPTCTQEELDEMSEYIRKHKTIRHITHLGQFYRIASHYDNPYAAFQYVSEDKKEALLFVLGHSSQFSYKVPNFVLQGVEPDTVYEIESYGKCKKEEAGHSAKVEKYADVSGKGLMELGVRVELLGDYDARLLYFKAK